MLGWSDWVGQVLLSIIAGLAALVALLALALPARADDQSSWHLPAAPRLEFWTKPARPAEESAAAGLSHQVQLSLDSDFAYRGMTLSSGHSVAQGSYSATYTPAKNIDLGGGAFSSMKYDEARLHRPVYGYWTSATDKTSFAKLSLNAFYLDVSNDVDLLTVEFATEFHRTLGKFLSVSSSIAVAPDALSTFGDMAYFQLGFELAPSPKTLNFGLAGHVGRQAIEDNEGFGAPDYADFELRAFTSWSGIDASVTATATDVGRRDCFDGTHDCDPRVFITLARSIKL
jgi:uncharacterized protein (TIGR02001 family)